MAVITQLFSHARLLNRPRVSRRLAHPLVFAALVLSLTACSEKTEDVAVSAERTVTLPQESAEVSADSAELTPARMGQWTRNCALCHVRGEGGAPVIGDREAWVSRLEQGEELLLQHTVEGLNNMPPLGYCMDCEKADFLALIRFMGGES